MNKKIKRIYISIIDGTILSILYFLYLNMYKPPNYSIFFIVAIPCFYLGIYGILGLEKSKKYLQNTEKFDTQKSVVFIEIIWWSFFAILCYTIPDKWIFFLIIAIGGTITYISGSYMRNIYRNYQVIT